MFARTGIVWGRWWCPLWWREMLPTVHGPTLKVATSALPKRLSTTRDS